jgi:4-amino-4-deoxy-L-arabinose transferase-like glycosyltransferase
MNSAGRVTDASGSESPRRWSIVILVVLLVALLWYRAHTFAPTIAAASGLSLWPAAVGASEPLDCDEAAYAYIGHRLLRGDVMYRDLTENKPPLGYWLYALAVMIGGYNELSIRLLPIPAVLLSIALVWWIGWRLAGSLAACLAAGLFALLSTDPYLFGNGSNLEHFMNLFSVASLALLILAWSRNRRWPIVAAGVCLGAATLVKQVAILPALVYLAALALRRRGDSSDHERTAWRERVGDIIAMGLGLMLAVGLAAGILLAQGAGAAAYEDIMQYGRALATDTLPEREAPSGLIRWLTGNADPSGQLPWPFGSTTYLVWWGTGSWPLWLAAIPATVYLLFAPSSSASRRLVAAWTIAASLQVVLPGLFWQHYYLLPTPGIALVVATALADCPGALIGHSKRKSGASRRSARAVAGLLGSALILMMAIGATLVIQVRSYLLVPPQELTVRYKGGGQWVVLRALGQELARRSSVWPDPHLYIWGWQSPLHFYGKLDGVTRHFFVDNLLRDQAEREHPLIKPRIAEIMSDLQERPPALIFVGYAPFPALRAFLRERYLPSGLVPAQNGLGLWVERDHFNAFERFHEGAPGSGSEPRRGLGRRMRLQVDGELVALPEFAHDGVPALAESVGAGRCGHRPEPGRLRDECKNGLGEPGRRLGGFHEQPRLAWLHGIADAPGTQSRHGHARRHRLQDHVAEGLGEAGECKEVAGRVMVGQVLAHAVARKSGNRADSPFQIAPRRPVAHEENAYVGPPGGHDRQRIGQVRDILLRGDPAHVADHQVIRPPAQRLAHLQASRPVGTEEGAVDTPRPEHQPLETKGLKALDRGQRRNVGLPCPVVKPAQIAPDRPVGPADPVVAAVLVEVGVKAGGRDHLAAEYMAQNGQPQSCLGGDMDDVGLERVNRAAYRSERGQRQIQLFVKGDVDRTDQVNVGPIGRLAIIGMYQLDPVAALGEMADEFAQRPGNAIDLGKVRFGNQTHAHGSSQASQRASECFVYRGTG